MELLTGAGAIGAMGIFFVLVLREILQWLNRRNGNGHSMNPMQTEINQIDVNVVKLLERAVASKEDRKEHRALLSEQTRALDKLAVAIEVQTRLLEKLTN